MQKLILSVAESSELSGIGQKKKCYKWAKRNVKKNKIKEANRIFNKLKHENPELKLINQIKEK